MYKKYIKFLTEISRVVSKSLVSLICYTCARNVNRRSLQKFTK